MTGAAKNLKPSPGSFGKMDRPRAEGDFYRSPTNAVSLLLDALGRPLTDGVVLDAGAGDGRLTEPLVKAGYKVVGVEISDRDEAPYLPIFTGVDFLADDFKAPAGLGAVVSNPPYRKEDSEAFVRKAIEIIPVGGSAHFLLRHAWMCAASRADLMPLLRQITICGRLRMMPFDREHDDKGLRPMTDFSWFSFEKGWTGDTRIIHTGLKERNSP